MRILLLAAAFLTFGAVFAPPVQIAAEAQKASESYYSRGNVQNRDYQRQQQMNRNSR